MKKIISSIIISLLFFICSCSNNQEHLEEKTIKFPAEDWGFPSPFAFYPAGPGYIKMSLIFDTLVWKDEKGIIPLVAESWQMSDKGKTWKFTLRKDIKFHDGHPLTVEDVVFTYRYMQQHTFPWTLLSIIDSIETDRDGAVVFKLKERYASFLEAVAGIVPIIPHHIWMAVKDPRKFQSKKALIGSGPFILEQYKSEHGVYIYRLNPNYFLGRPKVNGIAYVPCGDPVLGLVKGEINAHTLWRQQLDAVERFRKDSRYKVLEGPSNWLLKLIFNTKKVPLNDFRIRQAFAYAIDRRELCQRVKHNHAIPGKAGILTPDSSWYNPRVKDYRFSLVKANKLLDDAGYQNYTADKFRTNAKGKKLSFELLFGSENSREAEFIKDSMRRIGIEIKLKIMDGRTIFTLMQESYDDFELAINGHGGISGDPDLFRRWFGEPVGNNGFWYNAEFQELTERQSRTLDREKRKELIYEIQNILAYQLPVLILWNPKIYFVYRHDIFNDWFYTKGGIAIGIPLTSNKLAFVDHNEFMHE